MRSQDRFSPVQDYAGEILQDQKLYALGELYFAVGEVSDVYECMHLRNNHETHVAVKCMRGITTDGGVRADFNRQLRQLVKAWGELKHTNVMPCLGITDMFGPIPGFILPMCKNRSIMAYITQKPEVNRLHLIAGVASGLNYLHSKQMVHADIRGANIMISDEGKPLLMDIGLSLIVDRTEFTVAGVFGACRWQAPEVLNPSETIIDTGESPFTLKSDMYSFGMTILEVLTGKVPFSHRRYDTVVILDVIRGTIPTRPAKISDDMWNLLKFCWDQRPHARPPAKMVVLYLSTMLGMQDV